MLTIDSRIKILQFINENKIATITELADKFNVHEATIRRDLSLLEDRGQLQRTHGGVVKNDEVSSEPPFNIRQTAQVEEKRRIGEFTEKLIKDGDNIILDSGTTTASIVGVILKKRNITTITNDLNIATQLNSAAQNKVIVTGGNLYPDSHMLNGRITDETFKESYANIAFIGTPAFHYEKGLLHFDDYLVSAKKEMIKAAKKVIDVADHTKIGKDALYRVAEIKEIDALITTREITGEQEENLERLNIDVFIV